MQQVGISDRIAFQSDPDPAGLSPAAGRSSENGVVDRNLRVWGHDNLFVCSRLVYPTGSHSNPTLTLLALALRLVDHLKMASSTGTCGSGVMTTCSYAAVWYIRPDRIPIRP